LELDWFNQSSFRIAIYFMWFAGGKATISGLTPRSTVWVRVRTVGLKGVMGAWERPRENNGRVRNRRASPNELYSLDNFTSGVPEPSSLAFLALGFTIVAGLVSARRTRPL
jgi:hypothetical protein